MEDSVIIKKKMQTINRLILLTIIFNFFIIVGAGHGYGFLGLVEILSFRDYVHGKVEFCLTCDYYDQLFVAAIIAIVGQITLLFAYFTKTCNKKKLAIWVGAGVLLLSYIASMIDFVNMSLNSFSFWAGFPFLTVAVLLIIKALKIAQ